MHSAKSHARKGPEQKAEGPPPSKELGVVQTDQSALESNELQDETSSKSLGVFLSEVYEFNFF